MPVWDFDVDEWLCLVVAAIAAGLTLSRFYAAIVSVRATGAAASRLRVVMAGVPVLALAIVYLILSNFSDPINVRGHADYEFLFMVCGAAWIGGVLFLMPLIGYSPRDDAIERENSAAVVVTAGAVLGFTLAYAGANIGYGPTIETTLGPAMLASAGLLAGWLLFEFLTGASDAITIDRDMASGVRLAAFLLCAGAILGRAVAGDWNGSDQLLPDLARLGWPVLVLLAVLVINHSIYRPTPMRTRPNVIVMGALPAIVCVALTSAYLLVTWPPTVLPDVRARAAREVK